jgi:hypothetical protein
LAASDCSSLLKEYGSITIENLAARHVRAIKKARSSGPYHLCGFCFGGLVAYEIARLWDGVVSWRRLFFGTQVSAVAAVSRGSQRLVQVEFLFPPPRHIRCPDHSTGQQFGRLIAAVDLAAGLVVHLSFRP